MSTREDLNSFENAIVGRSPIYVSTCPSVSGVGKKCGGMNRFIVENLGVSAEVYYHGKYIRALVNKNVITVNSLIF
jgi:hypothetical protein